MNKERVSLSELMEKKKEEEEEEGGGGGEKERKEEKKQAVDKEEDKVMREEEHKEEDKHDQNHNKLKSSTSFVEAPGKNPSELKKDVFVLKIQTTNPNDDGITDPEKPDPTIPVEEAFCNVCFTMFEAEETVLKTKCKCKNVFVHERCLGNKTCDVCEEELEKTSFTLRQPSDAVHKHKGIERKLLSLIFRR
ncbi:hypothetical protein LguiB_026493 [Lonicera macranthoides]